MQLDWITIAAQILNFLVLLWILRRLVYGPLTRAMEARERRIREAFEEAEKAETAAEAERERLASEREDLEARRSELIAAAEKDAEDLRERLEAEAREAAEKQRADWAERLETEGEAFVEEMRRRAADRLAALARRALSELASMALETAVARAFARRLDDLSDEDAEALREAAAGEGAARIETAFPADPETRETLETAARKVLGDEVSLDFAEAPELICGVRLRARGRTVTLSLDGWAERFAEEMRAALDDLAPEARADAAE